MSRVKDFDLVAGTTDMYRDPIYYDHEFKARAADIRWYSGHYLEAEGPTLELGVGSGRVAVRAVRQGAEVVGLDISASMLTRAAARRRSLPKDRRHGLHLVRADMRHFAFSRRFPVIACPFNAFQHMYTREDVEACLACVREHLEPDGLFLFDVLMPDFEYLSRPPFKKFAGVRFKHPTHGVHYVYGEQTSFDIVSQINQMWLHYDLADEAVDAPPSHAIQLSHRYFFPAELEALLHYNGLKLLCRYGDFEQGELRGDSESMVVVAGRR